MNHGNLTYDSKQGWIVIPVSLIALGLGAVAMLTGSDWIRENLVARRADLAREVGQVQTHTAVAHLWLEEMVGGDQIDRNSIFDHLTQAKKLTNVMVDTGELQAGWLIGDSVDLDLLAKILVADRKVQLFADLTRERFDGYDAGLDVSIGSPIDVRYDAIFLELLRDLSAIEQLLNDQLALAEARSTQLYQTILAVWITLVSLAVWGIWSQERKRRSAETALHESEAQLLQAQKMEAVGRLAGGIAHDINNHLAAITAQCELVKLGAGTETLEDRMEAILSTASKSSAMIRRLLAFSRQQPVLRETVDVNQVVDGLKGMLVGLLSEDIELRAELSPALWSVEMDPSQLEQVILNLVVNARDAMPRGGRLTIETCNTSVEEDALDPQLAPSVGSWVMLSVTDDGAGISPDVIDRIFEPFFTTKDSSTGSGLGLATIHGIVNQSKGHVTVESTPERGSCFHVFFPRSHRQAEEGRAELVADDVLYESSSASILLVEDNVDLRDSTRQILESMGYSVTAVTNSDAALAIHGDSPNQFDVLLTDVIMPGMDGKQLADELRAIDPELRVIFVSGYTDDVILARGIDSDELNFLPKPFSAVDLRRKLLMVLNRDVARHGPHAVASGVR